MSGGWQYFLVGVIMVIGTGVSLGMRFKDETEMLRSIPFNHLMVYGLIIAMAFALLWAGAIDLALPGLP